MPNPFVNDDGCEWFEVLNTTAGALNLFQADFISAAGASNQV